MGKIHLDPNSYQASYHRFVNGCRPILSLLCVQWVSNIEHGVRSNLAPHREGSQRPVGLNTVISSTRPDATTYSLRPASSFQIRSWNRNPPTQTSNAHVPRYIVRCCLAIQESPVKQSHSPYWTYEYLQVTGMRSRVFE
jgi:hypothetical protein